MKNIKKSVRQTEFIYFNREKKIFFFRHKTNWINISVYNNLKFLNGYSA